MILTEYDPARTDSPWKWSEDAERAAREAEHAAQAADDWQDEREVLTPEW